MPVSRSDGGETPTSGRHGNSTFASGNTASLTHGGRSQRVRGAALPNRPTAGSTWPTSARRS